MREALLVAKKNGVDPNAVIDMLTQTLFPAPIYQSYGKRIVAEIEVGQAAVFSQSRIPLKDFGLFKQTAQEVEAPIPIASLLYDLLRAVNEV